MSETLSQMLFLLFIVSVITLAVSLVLYYQQFRRRAFIDTAASIGLQYHYLSYGLPRRLTFVYQLRRGKNRFAYNIITGRYKGYPVHIFDYHYVLGDKYRKTAHNCSIALLRHGLPLPEVRVYPPAIYEKVSQMAGISCIEFHTGDSEFANAFTVLAAEERFSDQFCHPAMIEYLLRHKDMSVEVGEQWIATCMEQPLVPEEIPRRAEQLLKILRALPEFKQ